MEAKHLPPDERPIVSTAVVRRWALEIDPATNEPRFKVGSRGHIPHEAYTAYNRFHRKSRAVDKNDPYKFRREQDD
jgi:hypothetical protein